MEITYFTPGQLLVPGSPLASFQSAVPSDALGPYLDAYSRPGDLVIDLFCASPTLIREAVVAGRRALGLNVNRALLLAASLGLTAIEGDAVVSAFTHLSEAHKGMETLQAHIEGLYRTTCAECGAETIADAFVWERDEEAPSLKRYCCTACSDDGASVSRESPTDEFDRDAAARFERRGLNYWLLLDRAAPDGVSYRGRMVALLDLYTPRNLAAINDLLLKSEALTLSPAVRNVLDALLLDTFDRATSLRSGDSLASRPRRLKRPARYVEENVWRLFERTLETWQKVRPLPIPYASSLDELLGPDKPETLNSPAPACFHLAPLSTSLAARRLPNGCASLVVVDPPRPDTVLWQLSALWCHWLWGSSAGEALTPFLTRRRLDKEWLWRGLRGALHAVAPLLRPDGRLVCLFVDKDPAILEALALAATGARYELVGWGARASGETCFTWRRDETDVSVLKLGETDPGPRARTPMDADLLSRAVAECAADTSINVLCARGEPVAWATLHAAIYAGLAEDELLARATALKDEVVDPLSWLADIIRSALDGAPLRQLSPQVSGDVKGGSSAPLWWLYETLKHKPASPLSDRVELAVAQVLRSLLAVTEADLHRRICARFPGPQTPDSWLIRLCLFSYGDEHAPGHWRLRSEDDQDARAAETDAVIADLTSLGRRLGFKVVLGIPRAGEWAVRWQEETGYAPYVFAVRTTAVLGDLLFTLPAFPSPSPAERQEADRVQARTTPCLTLPGGRAVLVGYKFRHNPLLRQQVARQGWQFLKFRHLRHLLQEETVKQLDRYAFQAALGLDPIVEQEEAQLSLW